MPEFQIPILAEGSVAAPTGVFTFIEPSAESVTFLDVGPMNTLEIPEFGWAQADGVNPLRLIVKGNVYDCGGIGPTVAATLAVSGAARATVVGTYTGQPGDGEQMTIGRPNFSTTVTFKSALVTNGTLGHQVLIGASADATYTNLYKLINGTGVQGTEYFNVLTFLGFDPSFQNNYFIEASALDTTGDTITLRYTVYGSIGNTSASTESVAIANFSFASTTFTGGSDGTDAGHAPSAGTRRYFYTWYRDADGAETFRSPIASIMTSGNYNIAISVLAPSADTTFDYIRVYGTTDRGVEFYLVGAVPRASTTYTVDTTDTTLALGLRWNELLYRAYEDGMPPRGRALAFWNGRLWTLGAHLHADYTRSTVAVVKGSATVTFAARGVTSFQRGMTFQVAATSETYRLISVDEVNKTAVLDRAYQGSDDATASFKIMDDYDAAAIRASVDFLYNQWPESESPGRVDTDDPEGGTALLATKSRLFAFSRTSIASVTGDGPESWELTKVGQGVGCVAPRLCVGVEGGGIFLSFGAFYAISPDTTLSCISSSKAAPGERARGIDGTLARVNWDAVDQGYSCYDTEQRIVVFGLPLDGATVPNYEIAFDLDNSTWTTFKRAQWTAQAQARLPGGAPFTVAGDQNGNLWHEGIGDSDGFYGQEAVRTLTAATVRVLTDSTASFTTTGDALKGIPVLVLYADGTTVAYGKIASNTGTALTLAEDLATAPAVGDQIVIGGIAWQVKTGFSTLGEEYRRKFVRTLTIRHAPTTRGEYHLSFAVDGGSFQLVPSGTSNGTLSEADGKITHRIQWPGDSHAFNLRGFKPGGRAVIRGFLPMIDEREMGR